MGEGPVRIEPNEWEGYWTMIATDQFLSIKVVNSENGVLRVRFLDGAPKEMTVYLRESGDWNFAIFGSSEDDETDQDTSRVQDGTDALGEEAEHSWARIKKVKNVALLWAPDTSQFRQLVESGKVAGNIDDGEVILNGLKAEDVELIASNDNGTSFVWDNPIILIRLSDHFLTRKTNLDRLRWEKQCKQSAIW